MRPHPPFFRRLPILLILAGGVLGLVLLRDRIGIDTLAAHANAMLAFRDAHYLWASLAFILLYIVTVSLSLPGATLVTLTGGMLFGLFPGVFYNVVGATLGGILVFLAARAGFGEDVAKAARAHGGAVARMQGAVARNQWSAMLTMRLIPVLPFFLVNLIAASIGVRLLPFAAMTFVGIIPAGLVFTSVGAGLGEVLARGEVPDAATLITPPILLPLLGLAALAALPMLVAFWQGKEIGDEPDQG